MKEFIELGMVFRNGLILVVLLSGLLCSYPRGNTVSTFVFKKAQQDLLPGGVQLIVTDPFSAFFIVVQISIFLALVISLPVFLYAIAKYLQPALFEHEKKAIAICLLPAMALFLVGCAFSYSLIIPRIFKMFYPFVHDIGAVLYFPASNFISLVFSMMITVGTIFLLPVAMGLLNTLGITDRTFWMKYWRHIIFAFLVFAAIIDATGFTMLLLGVPFSALYFLGAMIKIKKG